MKYKILVLLFMVIGISSVASEKIKMGLFDLKNNNVDSGLSSAICDKLVSELVSTGRFIVVDRKKMEQILKEQQFQKTGCTSAECAVEVGRLLNVSKMIMGSVNKVGNTYSIDVTTVDVETAEVQLSESGSGDSEDSLNIVVKNVAANLAAKTPVEGKIVELGDDNSVIVDLGYNDNVTKGNKFRVNRLKNEVKDASGVVIMRRWEDVGEIELTDVQKQASEAKITSTVKPLKAGDIVKISEVVVPKKEAQKKIITTQVNAASAVMGETSAFGAAWRSAVLPGWGQFYAKDDLGGWVFTVGGILSAGMAVLGYLDMQRAYQEYKDSTDLNQIETLYQAANDKLQQSNGKIFVFGIIWGLNILDAVIFYNPNAGKTADLNNKLICELDQKDLSRINIGYRFKW